MYRVAVVSLEAKKISRGNSILPNYTEILNLDYVF
ncbi:hypothetical protein ABH944_001729 [Caballeronia udeis]|uniref:Uncharacterized protein n=1 Tax=Caballeronia udeis TaxID=1232866 RepID=A0ABW8MI74_9BURK